LTEIKDIRNAQSKIDHKFVVNEISFLINQPESFHTFSMQCFDAESQFKTEDKIFN
jgi:hypothetical protein